MNRLRLKVILLLVLSALTIVSCNRIFAGSASGKAERKISGSSRGYRESGRVKAAKKRQERSERKKDKAYAKYVKASRKRTYEIQSPEVKERMKQNQANLSARDKARTKKVKTSNRKTGRKYR